MTKTRHVLIHNFDPVCAGFVNPDNLSRKYTVLYNSPVWAQKNAQAIWDQAARESQFESVKDVEFISEETSLTSAYEQKYELIYRWIPFDLYNDVSFCEAIVREVADAILPGSLTFMVGPPDLVTLFQLNKLSIICSGGANDMRGMPGMLEHLRVHPKTRVNPRITVILGEKCTE